MGAKPGHRPTRPERDPGRPWCAMATDAGSPCITADTGRIGCSDAGLRTMPTLSESQGTWLGIGLWPSGGDAMVPATVPGRS
jgi:hypothetical protein